MKFNAWRFMLLLTLQFLSLVNGDSDIRDIVLRVNLEHKTEINIFLNLNQKGNTEVEQQFKEAARHLNHIPKLLKTNMRSVAPLQQMFTEQSLTVAWITWDSLNDTLNVVDRLLWKLHYKDIILIYHQPQRLRAELEIIFQMCWKLGFTSVLIRVNRFIFTYHPYPSIRVETVHNISEFDGNSRLNNFHLYNWPQPAVELWPRFSSYINRHGHLTRSGYVYKLISVFLTHHNGSVSYYFMDMWAKNVTIERLLQIATQKGFAFSPILSYYNEYLLQSNPIYLAKSAFMVLSSREISEKLYLVIPFDSFVWLVILFTALAFFLLILTIAFKDKQILNMGKLFVEAFCIIMFISIPAGGPKTVMNYLLNLLFTFTGFFLTNFYSTSLSSLYTSKVYEPPLRYLADIGRTNLRIFEYSLDVDTYDRLEFLPPIVRQRVYAGNDTELIESRQKLNMSYIYTLHDDVMDYLLMQQMYLKHPIAKSLEEALYYRPLVVHMPHRSPLFDQFNRYLSYIRDSGLFIKFKRDAYWEGLLSGNLKLFRDADIQEFLTLQYFEYAFVILGIGLAFAVLSFLIENICGCSNTTEARV